MIPPVPPRDERIADRPLSELPATPPRSGTDDRTSDTLPGTEQYADDVIIYVNECLDRGSSPSEVAKSLLVHDFSEDEARRLVNQIVGYRRENGIHTVSRSASSDPLRNKPHPLVIWGFMLVAFGMIWMCAGFMMSNGRSIPVPLLLFGVGVFLISLGYALKSLRRRRDVVNDRAYD